MATDLEMLIPALSHLAANPPQQELELSAQQAQQDNVICKKQQWNPEATKMGPPKSSEM